MTHETFCYWLQGILEANISAGKNKLNKRQTAMIEEKLQETFVNVTKKIVKIEDIADEIKPLGPYVPEPYVPEPVPIPCRTKPDPDPWNKYEWDNKDRGRPIMRMNSEVRSTGNDFTDTPKVNWPDGPPATC